MKYEKAGAVKLLQRKIPGMKFPIIVDHYIFTKKVIQKGFHSVLYMIDFCSFSLNTDFDDMGIEKMTAPV